MMGMLMNRRCAPAGPHKHKTKASNGLHNHCFLLTMVELTQVDNEWYEWYDVITVLTTNNASLLIHVNSLQTDSFIIHKDTNIFG